MRAVRATCIVIALAFFVGVVEVVDGDTNKNISVPPETLPTSSSTAAANETTTAQPITSTTLNPATTAPTTKPMPTPTTSTTVPSTTNAPPPITTKTIPPTDTPTSSAAPPTSTTAVPPTPTPCPSDHRHYDGLSFMGGIILTAGLVAISFILWKFYKARAERNYRTL